MSAPSLSATALVVREEILKRCAPESCIETARALIEVLRYFGTTAKPVPVRVTAFNAEAAALTRAGVPQFEWPPSAHSVGISGNGIHRPGRWNGHLVAITAGHLVDASLDQLSRPGRGITIGLGTGVFALPAGWAGEMLIHEPPEGLIVYGLIADHTYRFTPAWREHGGTQCAVVASAIRRLRSLS